MSGYSIAINPIIIRIPFVIAICLFISKYTKEKGTSSLNIIINNILGNRVIGYFLMIMVVSDMIFAPMRAISVSLYRVSLFFAIFKCIAFSRLTKILKGDSKIIMCIAIIFYLVILWIYQNVIQLNDEIYPYTSSILGIK